jgi:hypothetical protein
MNTAMRSKKNKPVLFFVLVLFGALISPAAPSERHLLFLRRAKRGAILGS